MGITLCQFARSIAAFTALMSVADGKTQGTGERAPLSDFDAGESWLPLPDGRVQRMAFGSCAKHWQPQPIWDAVIAQRPDLFLFIGDAIYADTDGKTAWLITEKSLRGEWNRLADKPEFQSARASFPFIATWAIRLDGSVAFQHDLSLGELVSRRTGFLR